jgi:hypothetical protein
MDWCRPSHQVRLLRAREAALATTAREARLAVRRFKRHRAEDLAARQTARPRLADNADRSGRDADGLTLDRREFVETKKALRWLASCHMGWCQRDDRPNAYRRDLYDVLKSVGDFDFPPDSQVVRHVRKDGKAWYAYRMTPSGHFAIGASGPPPDQWLYDGTTPPPGDPAEGHGWINFMSPDPPEWREEPAT